VPVHALKSVSFEVGQGEFVAIMGPSGSGKSTLLHQLALLDTPTSGRISLDNIDVSTLPDHKKTDFRLKHLGYVFQEYALIPELNAIENTFLPLLLLGVKRRDYLNISGKCWIRSGFPGVEPPHPPVVGRRAAKGGYRPGTGK
jgi:putative ABC transport system ATP-binding protein